MANDLMLATMRAEEGRRPHLFQKRAAYAQGVPASRPEAESLGAQGRSFEAEGSLFKLVGEYNKKTSLIV